MLKMIRACHSSMQGSWCRAPDTHALAEPLTFPQRMVRAIRPPGTAWPVGTRRASSDEEGWQARALGSPLPHIVLNTVQVLPSFTRRLSRALLNRCPFARQMWLPPEGSSA